jgi:hypothetical protein
LLKTLDNTHNLMTITYAKQLDRDVLKGPVKELVLGCGVGF